MPDVETEWRRRVQAIWPDLTVERIEVNQEGLVNDVAVVNGEWVFRFAKTERSADIMARELKILDLVRPRLDVAVPAPVHRARKVVVYPYLEGQPLLRETLYQLEAGARARLAGQLGAFLHRLHTTDLAALG